MPKQPISPAVIRGQVIDSDLVEFGGRGGDISFLAPDPHKIIDRLPLGSPSKLDDLYRISFDEILDYLEELGRQLAFDRNEHMQEACELSYGTAPVTPPILRSLYQSMPAMFERERIRTWCETSVPIPYLEGWVETQANGFDVAVRAYGSRCLHVVAGNAPSIGAVSVMRGAVTRGDTIIKAPSNDPFTTGAIARTMCDFAPDHPITKHVSVAYWRGGDEEFESRLYQPHNIEKIVAWGGFASVKHVTKYIQPGLELISLDPKRSAAVVGADALESSQMLEEAAARIATDVGAVNQNACASCRLVYVMCGTDDDGIATLSKLGKLVYEKMMGLPPDLSTKPKSYDPSLKADVDALRLMDDWYEVIGGEDGEGAVIVSHTPEAVDFADALDDRTVNLIPVDTMDEILDAVDAYTQTVGVFPHELIGELRHKMSLHGAQRFVSLGYAFNGPGVIGPQDAIEPVRRMCKWIVVETPGEQSVPLWELQEGELALSP
ncbi:MAG: long-chain-fatty-acyl-CoA reductase [Novosphingobium sp.]|nr:long-chain-fatty-acyl-CoA reductase [Novosphingobium sp.]MCP5403722.1 long-chain-fatty-acyl-CoA reductase [Novosphingobium sp.]